MPTVETTRGTLYYADHRKDPAKIPLLLIHGAAGTHLDWSVALRRLGAVAPDLPGHGKSSPPGRDTITDYAADMIALLDALSLPHIVVMGHSMGGAVALTLALDYPDRLHGLILIGTGAKLRVSPDILEHIREHPEAVARLLQERLWAPQVDSRTREIGYQQFLRTHPNVSYGDYLACDEFDVRERLGEIQTSTLVIGGTHDQMTPLRYSTYLAKHIPNTELITVDGGGHMMALEQPALVADAAAKWLARLQD